MKLTLLYLNLLHAASDGFSSALILLLPFITSDLRLNLTEVGFLGSSFTLLTVLLALPAGTLSIKFGGMRVLAAAVLAYGLGYILVSFANSFAILMPIFLLCAAGFALFNPIGYGLIARFSKMGNRGKIIGAFSSFGDIGKLVLTFGLSFIVAAVGWRNTSLFYGSLALLFFAFLLFSHYKNRSIHQKQERPSDLPYKDLLRNRKFLLAMLAGVIDYTSSYPLFIFLSFVLLHKGVSPTFLGPLFGLYFIGNLLGKNGFGRMTDKVGAVKTFILAEICTASAVLLLVFTNNVVIASLLTLALGVLGKGTTPVTQTMVSDSVEHHKNFEKSISVYSLIGNVAAMGGSIFIGIASDKLGVNNAFAITAILALLAILPALAFARAKTQLSN